MSAEQTIKQGALKVWWIPQIPGKAFYVPVASVDEGVKLLNTLAQYDLFQFEHDIKPDYANAGGLLMFRPDLRCMDNPDDTDWTDWYYEDDAGNYFDDPDEYLALKQAQEAME
jgi:hypothetical protein